MAEIGPRAGAEVSDPPVVAGPVWAGGAGLARGSPEGAAGAAAEGVVAGGVGSVSVGTGFREAVAIGAMAGVSGGWVVDGLGVGLGAGVAGSD